MEAAKKAFGEGKAFFDKGKFDKAVEKFKESYRLSKNPLLLYNIALTFEKLGTNDMALFYYKKFLSDAPEGAAQRPDAEKSIAALESAGSSDTGETDTGGKPDEHVDTTETPDSGEHVDTTETPEKVEPKVPKKVRRDTCLLEDFQHEVVDEAPPGKPLDLSAFVSEDATCDVVLYYRGHGDDKFATAPMRPRYNELVARIPAAKMSGNAVQYYIEVKSSGGDLVTRVGKATSPNVVFLDESAKARFYPDLDDGDAGNASADTVRHDDDDNPLDHGRVADDEDPGAGSGRHVDDPGAGHGGSAHRGGFFDAGSTRFGYAKWGATGLGGGGLILSITFSMMASSWANSIEAEADVSNSETCPGGPPCRTYDDYRKGLEATGRRYETMSKVFFGVGLVGVGVAAYYWYEELFGKKKGQHPSESTAASTSSASSVSSATGLRSLTTSPIAGDGIVGGSAAFRF